jgi:hypothetical protein
MSRCVSDACSIAISPVAHDRSRTVLIPPATERDLIRPARFSEPWGRENVSPMRGIFWTTALFFGVLAGPAFARPTAPRTLCAMQDVTIAACQGSVPSCTLCHQGPPEFNGFGGTIAEALDNDPTYDFDNFDERLPFALRSAGVGDSDGDGLSNLEELLLGTLPGDAQSHFVAPPPPDPLGNAAYDVGARDANFAFRRVSISFCGRPPNVEELTRFRALAPAAQETALHATLDTCLSSSYWRDEALHRMADSKIRPLQAVGFDGLIPLADYAWDYRLFSYVMSGDRDVRDLLLADYHLDESGGVVRDAIAPPVGSFLDTGGQPLEPRRRAGMLTTQWFLMIHTMFSALPRTTAAQAYRAYLGMDLARGEGIDPVDGEPRDVDGKGVGEPACAQCHSTLDPLAYAFSPYQGIGRYSLGGVADLDVTGTFDPDRMPWSDDSVLLGEPVSSLRAWAERAVEQDAFFATVVRTLWVGVWGRPPTVPERSEFERVWRRLAADAAAGRAPTAESVLHSFIDTDAFRVP